jgi:hypothetical protein
MARPLAALVTFALVVLGMWVTGGLITDDFAGSAILTTVFFGLTGAAVFLLLRRHHPLRWWVAAGYLVAAAGVGGYVAYTSQHSVTVHEQLTAGETLLAGMFTSGEHHTAGTAKIVRAADGRRVLTLSGFTTSPGPDVRVRLVSGRTRDGGADGHHDLGGLKGNRGDQQYTLPADAPDGAVSVVIWCRAFSAEFGSAYLT